jgi:stage V sporulation protein B
LTLLFLASLGARVGGSLFRLLLLRLAGEEATGLFQLVIPVFHLAVSLGTLGLPLIVARQVASMPARRIAVLRGALLPASLAAALAAGGMALLASPLALILFRTPPAASLLYILAPAVILASLTSILKGYHQGRRTFLLYAVAEIGEIAIRLPSAALLILSFPSSVEGGARGAALSVVIGELGALLLLLGLGQKLSPWEPWPAPWPQRLPLSLLLRPSLPLLGGHLLGAVLGVVEAALIPWRIRAGGHSPSEALSAYGLYSGLALPLIYLPLVLLHPVGLALIPEAASSGPARIRKLLGYGTRMALLVSLGPSAALLILPGFFSRLLLGSPEAERVIVLSALAIPPLGLQNVLASLLTGLGKTAEEFRHHLAGVAFRLVLIYFLVPRGGIEAVILALAAGQTLTAALHAIRIWRSLTSPR